jgi:phosphoglycolate phosphatase
VALRPRAILFDMDNTLLQSNIDYAAMKADVYEWLAGSGLLPDGYPMHAETTSTMIMHARGFGLSDEQLAAVWRIAARHETAGMAGAGLKPGAHAMLDKLGAIEGLTLAVMTNNTRAAADRALRETGVLGRFEFVLGREDVPELKPSPEAVLAVMRRCPGMEAADWLAVGDSWIDGAAAAGAGVPFIAYRADLEQLRKRGVVPVAAIEHWDDFALLVRVGV